MLIRTQGYPPLVGDQVIKGISMRVVRGQVAEPHDNLTLWHQDIVRAGPCRSRKVRSLLPCIYTFFARVRSYRPNQATSTSIGAAPFLGGCEL